MLRHRNYLEEIAISVFRCPICGLQRGIKKFDPSDSDLDITVIQLRGLGKGKGFEIVDEYSILSGEHPELLELISDRVAIVHDLLFETDDSEELLDDINAVLRPDYEDEAFENLVDAAKALLDQFLDYDEEDNDEEENDDLPVETIDKELWIADHEEDNDDEEEDISDPDEDITE